VRTDSIEDYLTSLAARVPAPGGGASAGLHAAQAAALVATVARYSDGERFAAHAETIAATRDRADELREAALALAGEDGEAFGAVTAAYALPHADDDERELRSVAVADALLVAARVPVRLIEVSEKILRLAERLRTIGNRTLITDVAAAAEALRATVGTSRVIVESALVGIVEPEAREELLTAIDPVDDIVLRAAKTTAAIRELALR
jgi:formiminotetrahydrofolate cyclodeaminase